MLGDLGGTCFDPSPGICVSELVSVIEDNELRYAQPDQKVFLGFHTIIMNGTEFFSEGNYGHFVSKFKF